MSDDEGLGDLFGGDEEEVPQYPLHTLSIRRQDLAEEGRTYDTFSPLLDRFDHITSLETAVEELAQRRQRLPRLSPPPLQVQYRDKRHSLWGHKLWNAAKYLVKRIDEQLIDVRGKAVIELGAGLGVPSIAAFKNGAKVCVVTDYPDADLLDIITRNVAENCGAGDVDADVKKEMEEEACRQLTANGDFDISSEKLAAAVRTGCHVEPLLWGKHEHIERVLQYTTGGAGFDVVILSDILFNHVCNDDLADTLAALLVRSRDAVGYCVFSHHRAFKQLHDLEFFDKCVRRGLQYEQVDEQEYPLMFPEDRGPAEVRQPVKCYRISRRYDAAGCGLDVRQSFDVVLQGTGMVSSILSAALARDGWKVLHCDGNDYYAGAMATFDYAGFLTYVEAMRHQPAPPSSVPLVEEPHIFIDRMADEVPEARRRRYLFDVLPMCYMARGPLLRQLISSGMSRSLECQHVSRFLFLQHGVDGVAAAGATTTTTAIEVPLTRAGMFSNTKVDLFGKRRMMRFVKDVEASVVEQLHAKTANPADNPAVANTSAAAEEAAAEATALFTRVADTNPHITLRELLQTKYGLSGAALDVVSLMGMTDVLPVEEGVRASHTQTSQAQRSAPPPAPPPLVQSVDIVRDLLLSTGAFDGKSPFLATAYGASEVSQGMCRVAAVWGGTFVLRRSLRGVAVDEANEKQYAVLSNGQWVPAKVIVVPSPLDTQYLHFTVQDWYYDFLKEQEQGRAPLIRREREEESPAAVKLENSSSGRVSTSALTNVSGTAPPPAVVRFSRVVLATKTTALFSWAQLEAASVTEVDHGKEFTAAEPVILALVREPETQSVVVVVQQTAATEQAPSRFDTSDGMQDGCPPTPGNSCVLHFTADARVLSQQALHAYVMRYFTSTAEAIKPYSIPVEDIALGAAFTVDSDAVAQQSVVATPVELPSETRWTHPFAWEESLKLRRATHNDREHLTHSTTATTASCEDAIATPATKTAAQRAAERCKSSDEFRMVCVPHLLPNLVYDGHYLQSAQRAYDRVLDALGVPAAQRSTATVAEDGKRDEVASHPFLKPVPSQA